MESYIIIALLAAVIVLLVVLLVRQSRNSSAKRIDSLNEGLSGLSKALGTEFERSRRETQVSQRDMRLETAQAMDDMKSKLETLRLDNAKQSAELTKAMSDSLAAIRLNNMEQNEKQSRNLSEAVDRMRESNEKKLEQMRLTVDEKLTATLSQRLDSSFKTVSDRLENVYKSLGEMKELSNGVTANVASLNRVLTNVKARGTWAEVQLGAILDQTIPAMYETNFACNPASKDRVEFAVRIPSGDDLLVNSSTSRALIDFYEYKLGDLAKAMRTNNEFMDNLNNISKLNTQISTMEITPDASNNTDLNQKREQLKQAEQNINDLALQLSEEVASTNNVKYEDLVNQWLEQVVLREKTLAQIQARDIMREKLDRDFLYFSPIGAIINRKERNIEFVEGNYMSILGALNQAILRQKNLEMTAATLKVMNPPLFPLTSSPTARRMILLATLLGTLLLTIGYHLIVELLDRTLRDKMRTERITGSKVIGAFPHESKLRYRRYNKAIDEMAIKQLSTNILPYFDGKEQRILNLLSTEEMDGKSHIGIALEEYWNSLGLNVRRITHDEDFLSEDSTYVQANTIMDICPDLSSDEIAIVEYPVLKNNPIAPSLLNEASLNLMIVRANRTWKDTDQLMFKRLLDIKDTNIPLEFCLTQASRSAVQDFTGQLPPYTKFKNFEYKIFQLGLTATEHIQRT